MSGCGSSPGARPSYAGVGPAAGVTTADAGAADASSSVDGGSPPCPAEPRPCVVEQIEVTRKPGEKGFDETKMYSIFSKSKTALKLEEAVLKKDFKYKRTSNTLGMWQIQSP